MSCRLITAERLISFANELSAQLPEDTRQEMMQAFREILLNAMEHGAAFNPEQVVEVTAVRTGRAMVFYVRDPGLPTPLLLIRLAILRRTSCSAKQKECALGAMVFSWPAAQWTS